REGQIFARENPDGARQIARRALEVGLTAQVGAELQLDRVDGRAAVAAVGLRRIAAGVAAFLAGGGLDAVTERSHVSENTLGPDHRCGAEALAQRGHAAAVVSAAKNCVGRRALAVNIEQQTAAPAFFHRGRRRAQRAVIRLVISFRRRCFEGGVFGAVGVDEFSLEARDHEKRRRAEIGREIRGYHFGQLRRVAVALGGELGHAGAAPRGNFRERKPAAVRRGDDNRQAARLDRNRLRRVGSRPSRRQEGEREQRRTRRRCNNQWAHKENSRLTYRKARARRNVEKQFRERIYRGGSKRTAGRCGKENAFCAGAAISAQAFSRRAFSK